MAAAVTGWATAAVLVVGGTAVATAAATPAWAPPAPPVAATAPGPATAAAPDLRRPGPGHDERVPPLPGEPARQFEPPPHEYGPGHRGIDLPAAPGSVVVSPAHGVVTFAGPVAGRGVVVLEHVGGTLTSLEPVETLLPVGASVGVGGPVARVQDAPRHPGCPVVDGCLHWGVRVGGRYVDPWWWLGRAGPVRLLPLSVG
ncbi:murein hydrolase activator EnvC family protein [Aquipuribacter sp. MA13-6]|uniref:murein hydrolase activator EnvC family protein n=1 Tax=unclassified Aquipuribacter TaxID=2635084 RepID=UPI003EE86C52